ncbi:MAG: class I SAM-dependent methyltransferase [Alphaproteobacteria bacterium]|nr:class I SAM-dependent methyltransferase [Alphaproteobacteria bacterium]
MTRQSLTLDDQLYDYLLSVSLREPPVMARLRAETAQRPGSGMQIAPEQGQFMSLLVELIGARLCLEVGTFTGYSALAVAHALPPDGQLICCDINAENAAVAERYWMEAGLADRIQLRLGRAADTLAELEREYPAGSFDFAFIDADKSPYDLYYETAFRLIRHGGLILLDNVLWSGRVADPSRNDPDTAALKALNSKLRDDDRVSLSLLPLGDGLTLLRKR